MTLKNTILDAWARCQTEHERSQVLSEIEAARHEIRAEYLWAEPELRRAVAALESELTAIMVGQYGIAEVRLHGHDRGEGQRVAPLVGLAGYIAMLLAARAEHRARCGEEARGGYPHALRIDDAIRQRGGPKARPGGGFTGHVEPVDPRAVTCRTCGAAKGERRLGPAKVREE